MLIVLQLNHIQYSQGDMVLGITQTFVCGMGNTCAEDTNMN